jgi:putative oxidoreductase
MKPIADGAPHDSDSIVVGIRSRRDSNGNSGLISPFVRQLDERLLTFLNRWSIGGLRVALGLVFLWFGALKLLGVSPVTELIQKSFPFLPGHLFLLVLGAWELLIGVGIVLKRSLRCVLILLVIHLAGTFIALCLNPRLFFVHGSPLLLTAEGEFVIKNLVLIAAGLVVGGYEIRPLR